MTRLLLILIMAGLVATGVVWLADNDGVATIAIAGYEFSTSASIALMFALILASILAALMRLVFLVFGRPSQFGSWAAERKAKQFFQALSHGLIAAASGDAAEAGHFGRRSDKLLKEQPLGLLLNAQAAQLAGEDTKEEAAYTAMLRFPDTEFLGLRGLYTLAMRRQDEDQALAHAIRAYALKPKAWAMNALFDLRVSRREWREAATLVMQATRAKVLGADVARRRRAVLLAAQAVEAERTGDAAAQSHALEALALAPGLTAAALIAVRHLIAQGRAWKAQDLIETAWSQMPHRELAEIYAAIRPEDDREARAVRLIGLAKLNSSHRESRVLMAEQFVALRQWDEARTVLTPLAEDFSSARVCNLMALIALGEQDVLTAQLWRSRAARAGRVADWRCVQCSSVAPEWAAVCRQCGAFDSLNWSAPEPTALVQLPRERAAPAQISGPMHAGPPPPSGVIVDATTRSRANVSSVRKDDSATRFLRLPDDPGPGGPSDIFEVDVEDGDTTTTRQKSG